ncbi:MAG: heme-dependent oxidative N-demethylase subunit alpha family protein [Acetobacteraceae bacterium]
MTAPGQASSVTPLPPERLLLPFAAGPFRMAMGLVGCHPDELVEIDDRYMAEMAERRALLAARHADVFAAEPGSEAARAEVLAVVSALLPRRYPGWFAREGRGAAQPPDRRGLGSGAPGA